MGMYQLKKAISKLTEQEAKSLLHLILLRSEQTSDELPQFLKSIRNSVMNSLQNESATGNPDTIHIVFSESTAGSLKMAFRDTPYEKTDEIIIIPDTFSEGPLKAIDTEEGFASRLQWLKEHYQWDEEDYEWYEGKMSQAFEKIKAIQASQKVIIWTGENASEQTGLRLLLRVMKDQKNDIIEMNTYKAFHQLYRLPKAKEEDYPRHTGEIAHEQLWAMYELYEAEVLSHEQRQKLANEGQEILRSSSLLRSWKDGKVLDADEDREDHFIIERMKKLHKERGNNDFMKSARLIGEVLGYAEQYLSDDWIEYRLRHLIEQGVFESRGDLGAMRFYEVRLKEESLA